MRSSFAYAVAALAFAGSAPALAGHTVVFGPRASASATSLTPNASAQASIINGVANPGDNYAQGNSTTSVGPATPGATSVWAATTASGGQGNLSASVQSYAAANLSTGILKASSLAQGDNIFGFPLGFATARLDDTIFFTNTSGTAQTVTLSFRFDGQMTNVHDTNPGGKIGLVLSCTSSACQNDAGDRIIYANGPTRTPNENWTYHFDYNGGCFAENIYCGQGAAPYFDYGLNQPRTGGVVDGYIRTSLLIPTGQSSIGLMGEIYLDCRGGSSCDFGHTGRFGFDPLPQDVTFGSASGVFLSQLAAPGVPEPANWALMLGGFGLLGAALRRRRASKVFA